MDIPGQDTLDKSIERSTRFLSAASKPSIFRILKAKGGYSRQQHLKGLQLLTNAIGIAPEVAASSADDEPYKAQQAAIAWCSDHDDTVLARLKGALLPAHPECHHALLAELTPGKDMQAVANLKLLLERRALLDEEPERVGGAQAWQKAQESLQERGMDDDFFAAIHTQVETAGSLPDEDTLLDEEGSLDMDAQALQEAKVELYFWHRGWADIARTIITRRDWLIQLGLAKKRSRTKAPNSDGSQDE